MIKLFILIALVLMSTYLFICPYTKVEESFNIQAIHDIFFKDLNQFDHLEFPGVVPRTFIGAIFLALCTFPFKNLFNDTFFLQLVARWFLGIFVIYSFTRFVDSTRKNINNGIAAWLYLITCSQFHYLFYSTRTLPNIFALVLVQLALSAWLKNNFRLFIGFSTAAILIFRFEVSIFLGCILLHGLITKKVMIWKVVSSSILFGILCLSMTIMVDSCFWGRWLWPEGEVLWFNTILNKSSQWGIQPFLWYFYSALPRGLFSTILFVPFGILVEPKCRSLVICSLIFVMLYSILPHKELRFIIYVIPVFNMAAAAACNYIWNLRKRYFLYQFLSFIIICHLAFNLCITLSSVYVSSYNYPGGVALQKLHSLEHSREINIHIGNSAAQTGVTRFLQKNLNWRYNKSENLSHKELALFTHLIVDADGQAEKFKDTHNTFFMVRGFDGLNLDLNVFPFITPHFKTSLVVLKKSSKFRKK